MSESTANKIYLQKTVDCGDSGFGKMVGLHFIVDGETNFYSMADVVLYELVKNFCEKYTTRYDEVRNTPQTS